MNVLIWIPLVSDERHVFLSLSSSMEDFWSFSHDFHWHNKYLVGKWFWLCWWHFLCLFLKILSEMSKWNLVLRLRSMFCIKLVICELVSVSILPSDRETSVDQMSLLIQLSNWSIESNIFKILWYFFFFFALSLVWVSLLFPEWFKTCQDSTVVGAFTHQ